MGLVASHTMGPEVLIPSFQPMSGKERAHSTMEGRIRVRRRGGAPRSLAASSSSRRRCSARPLE